MTIVLVVLVVAALIVATVASCADGWSRIEHDLSDLMERDQ